MRRAGCITIFLASILFSTAGVADDAKISSSDFDLSSVVALYVRALRSESEYTARWQPSYPVETLAYANAESRPIVSLDFEDSDAYSRVKKIRALSLLTVAEVKGTRLFFGVNRKGLVGIHFRALSPQGDERCLEIARMPYLSKNQADDDNP